MTRCCLVTWQLTIILNTCNINVNQCTRRTFNLPGASVTTSSELDGRLYMFNFSSQAATVTVYVVQDVRFVWNLALIGSSSVTITVSFWPPEDSALAIYLETLNPSNFEFVQVIVKLFVRVSVTFNCCGWLGPRKENVKRQRIICVSLSHLRPPHLKIIHFKTIYFNPITLLSYLSLYSSLAVHDRMYEKLSTVARTFSTQIPKPNGTCMFTRISNQPI